MSDFQEQNSCIPAKQRQIVQYTIDSIVGDTKLPEIVDDMLKDAWNEYMTHIIVSKGEYSKEWVDAKDQVKLLLWSLKPKKESIERKCLIDKARELMSGLKQGLELVNYGPYKTALIFEMLKEIHLEILKTGCWKNEVNTSQNALKTSKKEIASYDGLCDVLDIAQSANKIETEYKDNVNISLLNNAEKTEISITEKKNTESNESQEKEAGAKENEVPFRVDQPRETSEISTLKIGTWVEIRSGESVLKCKISRKVSDQQSVIFVNRHGVEVSRKSFSGLEADLKNGGVKILDDAFLFENALLSVIGNSRSYDKH